MCGYLIQEYPKWIDEKGKIPQGMVNPLQRSECWKVAQLDWLSITENKSRIKSIINLPIYQVTKWITVGTTK